MLKSKNILMFGLLMSLVFSGAALASSDEIHIHFKGLPSSQPGAEYGSELMLETIRLRDGVVTEFVRGTPMSDISIPRPEEPSMLRAVFLGTKKHPQPLEGFGSAFLGNSIEIKLAAVAGSKLLQINPSLPTFPPSNGIAIGYDPAGFSVTGPGSGAHHKRGFANIVISDLGQNKCAEGSDNQFELVETYNPAMKAEIEKEIALQQSSAFDPATKVEPHLVEPTHLATGSMTFSPSGTSATVFVKDRQGNILAQATGTSLPEEPYWTAIDNAVVQLSQEICREDGNERWGGTITYKSKFESKEEKKWETGSSRTINTNSVEINLTLLPNGEVNSAVLNTGLLLNEGHSEASENCGTMFHPVPGLTIKDSFESFEGAGTGSPDSVVSIKLEGNKLTIYFDVAGVPSKSVHRYRSKQVTCGKVVYDNTPEPTVMEGISDPSQFSFDLEGKPDSDTQEGTKTIRPIDGAGLEYVISWSLKKIRPGAEYLEKNL